MAPRPRRPLVSGNWKMNLDHFAAIANVQRLVFRLQPADYRALDVSVHPPFTDLRSVQVLLGNDEPPLALGAQHCHFADAGAFTGEVSPSMLAKLGIAYVICGHSERRQLFGETDEGVAARAAAVLRNRMVPIVCVGETAEERDAGATDARLAEQVEGSLAGLSAEEVRTLVIAYEPVWAIGTGRSATPDDAEAGAARIRSVLAERWGSEVARAVRIQYGGSVTPSNAASLLAQPDVDGALVGGASLDADAFADIVAAARGVYEAS